MQRDSYKRMSVNVCKRNWDRVFLKLSTQEAKARESGVQSQARQPRRDPSAYVVRETEVGVCGYHSSHSDNCCRQTLWWVLRSLDKSL